MGADPHYRSFRIGRFRHCRAFPAEDMGIPLRVRLYLDSDFLFLNFCCSFSVWSLKSGCQGDHDSLTYD